MLKIESRIGVIKKPDKTVFNFLSDFTNFESLIPAEKVKNWKATHDSCSFSVDGIGQTGLKILKKTPNNLIKISSDEVTPVTFGLLINIESKGSDACEVKIIVEPKVNLVMMAMIKAPLQRFVDMLIEQMETLKF